MSDKQTGNKRPNGQFAKGNTLGNRWKPGESGNPNGRRGSLADLFRELSDVKNGKGTTRHEAILDKVIRMAENGSLKAAEMYFSRIEGKPKEFVEQTIIKDEVIIE